MTLFQGGPVEWAVTVPDSTDGLVLYHYYRPDHPYGRFENLVRVKLDGSILWHAQIPEGDDRITVARLVGRKLLAYSFGDPRRRNVRGFFPTSREDESRGPARA